MKLKELLSGLKIIKSYKIKDITIVDIFVDSRKVKKGGLFVCLEGSRYDGHKLALDAVNKGAVAIVCERDVNVGKDIPRIIVPSTYEAIAFLMDKFLNHPYDKL
jgi:UDP-N-acetylmuramoyl-L-alanyl-D-glutamate--2,6-diaminopimelate ligase